jgi:hypothetical protein
VKLGRRRMDVLEVEGLEVAEIEEAIGKESKKR